MPSVLSLVALVLLLPGRAEAHAVSPHPDARIVVAAPAEGITVDGRLDEPAWATAEPATGFRQFEPDDGAPATFPTEVRVLYGPDALYIGARLRDEQPGAIRRILTRRDEIGDADRFSVAIDAYFDRQTAYVFAVSAAGVQYDALLTGNSEDRSWDGVWESAVAVTDEGWTVEMRIPYSQLRFTDRPEQTWGVQFQRTIPRLAERSLWAPLTREQSGAGQVQFFGRLEGLRGIQPRGILQVLPYTLARGRQFEDVPGASAYSFEPSVGADLKVGLASNVILDATINPDFGQVEADPAELNLSTFETFLSERRPFFLEGTQIFDFRIGGGDGSLLYTRRIGADARVIGASKVTGRLADGLSFGGLAAVTGHDLDPSRLFVATRLKQELGGPAYVGGGLTAYESSASAGGVRSLAGGLDWDLRLGPGDEILFEGSAAAAYRGRPGAPDDLGYAVYIGLDRVIGTFTWGSGLRVYSDRFRLNDVGRFRQNDFVQARLGGRLLLNEGRPFGPFRRANASLWTDQVWSYTDLLNRGFGASFSATGHLRSFQRIDLSAGVSGLTGYDTRETRGLGPVAHDTRFRLGAGFRTDERERFQLRLDPSATFQSDGELGFGTSLGVDWNASDRIRLSASAGFNQSDGDRAWAANESIFFDGAALAIGTRGGLPGSLGPTDRFVLDLSAADAAALLGGVAPYDPAVPGAFYVPVFGYRDTRSAEVALRGSMIFQPGLSLQLFTQLFGARGRYGDFQLLADRDTFRPFEAYPKRRDFSLQSFLVNAVLRWEYRPGSTLYVVWSQNRTAGDDEVFLYDGAPVSDSPFATSTLGLLGDTFGVFPENAFMVKLSYLFMR